VQQPRGVHVALLRGINVGGKNRIPMKGLADVFISIGCASVQVYIQSGNVVFLAKERLALQVGALVSEEIAKKFGLQVPVVTRTALEFQSAVRANPFLQTDAELETLHVAFLDEVPTASRVSALDPLRSPPDELIARGREIYLRLPNGAGRTKLTNAYFDSKLATTSTVRNWRTVLKLVEMTRTQGAKP
jgi:uncharacterized protein (DUF1697 family)